jgi:hypothetical protein
MAFLSIAGQIIEIDSESWGRSENILIGRESRAVAGNLRVAAKAVKRRFRGTTTPMSRAAMRTLRAVVDLRQIVSVTGDLVEGDTFNAVVRIGEAKALPGQGSAPRCRTGSFRWKWKSSESRFDHPPAGIAVTHACYYGP